MPAPDRRRSGGSLALPALAQLIFSLDLDIVYVALPDIGADLGFSDQTRQWVISAYVVPAGGFLLLGGRAADLLGRRRTFVAALTLYAPSSLAGGRAGAPGVIIAARAVQGIGGALLLPSTLSLIGTPFEEGPRRNRALAVRERRRFDLPGAMTVTGFATLLVFGLVQRPETGWTAPPIIGAFAAAAVHAERPHEHERGRDPDDEAAVAQQPERHQRVRAARLHHRERGQQRPPASRRSGRASRTGWRPRR